MSHESDEHVTSIQNQPNEGLICEWVKRAQRGDREAFNRLFELLGNQIRIEARTQYRQQRPESSLSDLLQVAWTRAFQKFNQFAGDTSSDEAMVRSLTAWLRKIVKRTASNAHRSENRLKRKLPESPRAHDDPTVGRVAANDPTPSQICTHEELLKRLRSKCEAIDDPQLRALIRAKLEGMSKAQFARENGWSDHQVRAAEAKVFKKLEAQLEDPGK